MSVQPPSDPSRSIPGYIIVLAALSVLILLFALGVGLIAFGVVDIGEDDAPIPTVGMPDQDLQFSGFRVLETREDGDRVEIDVNVAVTNTGDERLKNSTMLVQCLDGGNASNAQLIVGIDPDQTLQFEVTLFGSGSPNCAEPQIDFDTPGN